MHGIDATKLTNSFPSQKFDRIIFNFPHTGEQRVHINRALLHDFFQRSAGNPRRDFPPANKSDKLTDLIQLHSRKCTCKQLGVSMC
jgi:hypothetical protein